MKKILFATTALVATAGVAAAEVAVTGAAEIGVVAGNRYNSAVRAGANLGGLSAGRDAAAEFWTSIEVTFTMSGEADNGLTFGAVVQLDESTASGGTDDQGASAFIAFGGARLDMGDTDGALDWAMQEVNLAGAGSIDDSETAHPGFSGNSGLDGGEDGQVARFTYTFGDFAMALSAEVDDTPNYTVQAARPANPTTTPPTTARPNRSVADANSETIWGIGGKYSGDLGGVTLGVGLGYQTKDNFGDMIGVSVDAAHSSGVSFAVNYSEFTPDNAIKTATFSQKISHWGVGVGYAQNALQIGVNYGEWDNLRMATGVVATGVVLCNGCSSNGYGLAVNYDFGGGLEAQFGAGVGENKMAGGGSQDWDSFSLGLAMSF